MGVVLLRIVEMGWINVRS
jgi:hypothetical protein